MAMLRVLIHEKGELFSNLALDEAILRACNSITLRLWRNEKSVILGVNSRVKDEVNLGFAEANGIRIARRISGGGAVFHDLGNLNYSIIVKAKNSKGVEYLYDYLLKGTICSIRRVIKEDIGIANNSDLIVRGFKVSGNSGYFYRENYLLHGTLLLNSDIESLYNVLIIPPRNLKRWVDPVKFRVKNLEDILGRKFELEEVERAFIDCFSEVLKENPVFGEVSEEEMRLSERLKEEKYSKEEFIFRN